MIHLSDNIKRHIILQLTSLSLSHLPDLKIHLHSLSDLLLFHYVQFYAQFKALINKDVGFVFACSAQAWVPCDLMWKMYYEHT